jgi:mRNA-degrading endonuclease toxin of MazEF toxin-antitoxin module
MALAEQVTTVSKDRFIKYIGEVNPSEMMAIENSLMIQMGIGAKNNIAYA